MTTRILALVGSLRAGSYSRQLAEAGIWPRPCERFLPRGRRIERSLRRRWNMLASNTFRDGI